ncbi:MAG TPA: PKD domain-containing protein [Pyrinomonadaceae bacterium]|nr:PKD domain-containing protein [Pyrinomonadaceae bacterium]
MSRISRRSIALFLIYALLVQFIPQFSRVAHARTEARTDLFSAGVYKSPPLNGELASFLPSPPPAPVAETITDAVISRHKPILNNGRIEGSLRVLLGESFTIPNATAITSDVFLPGAPSVQVNNGAQHGGIVSDGGANTPDNYTLTLANNANLAGRVHTHADPIDLPTVATSVPPAAGTRTVSVNSQSQVASIGNWQTVRDLNVNGSHITVEMPPGNYGTLTVNGNSQVNLSAGTYNFANTFNLDGSARLQATGAVVINVAKDLKINSGALTLGSYTAPADVRLNVLGSQLLVNGSSQVSALISAYNGHAKFNGNSQVRGRVIADTVTMNGGKVTAAVWPVISGSALTLFGPRRFDRTTGQPNQYVEQFSLPAGTTEPFTLHIQNGSIDGTNRVSSAVVKVNGVSLFTQNDFNQNVASLERTITLNAQNQLDVRLASGPGSYLIINITGTIPATDTTAPLLEVTNPTNNFTTTDNQITVGGTASDPNQGASGVANVYVNDVEAAYNSSNNTWTLAGVSLALGANQLVVRAVDNAGNQTTVTVTVTREAPENHSPAADAGADQTITLPNTASLAGNATDDGNPEGSTLTTTWSKVSGPGAVTFTDEHALSTTASFSTHGTYILRLTASDGELSKTDDVTITVEPQNQPPTVSAGADQTIALPSTAGLNGVVTDDALPAGSTLVTTWSRVSGPGTVTFEDPSLRETVATFSEAGTYVLRLTATDGELTSQSEVTITVHPENQVPTVEAGADQIISLPADAQLNGTAADDGWPFGSTLTTNWTMVSGPGTVTFAAPNVTVTTASFSAAGTYVLRLTASDGQLSTTDDLTVVVTPPNQAPVVNAGADQIVSLPEATATLEGSAADDGLPLGSTFVVTWTKVNGPGDVAFGNANQAATTAQFTVAGDYILRLTASDGTLNSFDEVLVKVTPPNQPPVVSAGADQTVVLPAQANLNGSVSDDELPLNAPLSTTWSKVSGPGTVTFAAPNATVTTASFSVAGTYVLRLTANDTEFTVGDDITVLVEPENQPPVVNAGADQSITLPAAATLHGTVTDDGYPSGSSVSVSWSKISGPGTVAFSNATNVDTTASFSVAGTYVLRLTATDSQLTTSDDVQVIVIPQNFGPTVNAGADQNVSLPNTASLNGAVSDDGLPAGSTLTTLWTKVSGPGEVIFANSAVTVTTASFSAPGSYVLRLTADDSEFTVGDELTVTVIDPRVAPVANFIVPQTTGAAGGFVIATSGAPASSFAADQILDNNNGTSWTTNGPLNQFAKIQFYDQQSVYIDRVRIQGHQAGTGTSNVKDFEVQVSATTSDDQNFVTVLNATYVNNGQLQEFVFPGGPARARFIKYLPKNNHAGSGNIQTATFNPVAAGSIESVVSLPGITNGARSQSPALYLNGGVIHTFSYSGANNTANGLLGYRNGGWNTANAPNQFAIVQLGGSAPTTITGVKLATWFDSASGLPIAVKDFEIWVSSTTTDDAAFTRVLTASAPFVGSVQTYLFPAGPVPARYVKYVPLNNHNNGATINTPVFDVIIESGARVVGVSSENQSNPLPAEAAFDGDLDSAWVSQQNVVTNVWIKTALAGEVVQKLYGVRILSSGGISSPQGPKDFDIRVSTTTTDDSAFTTVFSGTLVGFNGSNFQEFIFPQAVDAKYVQFFWKNGYNSSLIGVRELEALIYPSQGSALVAFSSQDELASNCIDLDPINQVWSTASGQVTNQWIKLLLPRGELTNINHFALRPAIAANTFYNGPKDFEFQVSTTDDADSSFTTVVSGTFANNTQLQDYYFPTTQARYVKLLIKNHYNFARIGVASFYVYASDQIGTATRFFDQSTDADGPIVSWAWDFGDGGTSNERNPMHTYAQPGNYTVTLTVTDHTGLTHAYQSTYRVVEALRPSFTHSPVIVHEAGELVRFTDITRLMVQPIAQRRYNFGDGGTLSQNASTSTYTYPDSGVFNATMSVGDPLGLNHTATRTVQVLNMTPSVNIDPGKTVVWGEQWTIVPSITDQSAIDRVSLSGLWSFGDGQTSTCVNCTNANATVTHSYANPGTYNATLTITDKDGGVGSDTAIFIVNKRPTAVVFPNPAPLIASGPLTLQARLVDTFANASLPGKPLQLSVNGALFNAVTDANGVAQVTVPLPAGTRIDTIIGTFAGDDFYLSGNGVTVPVTAGTSPPPGSPSSAGTDFWLMFPHNFFDGNNGVQRLFITSPVATTGTVTVPFANFTQNFSVAANTVTTVQLPFMLVFQSDLVQSRSVHVTSASPITVYGLAQRAATSDAYLALPVSSLGKDHLILTYSNMTFAPSSQFGIVAPQNNTVVTITPSVTTGTRVAGVPYNITLNQGQTYLLQNTIPDATGDLTGSRITADKPISVFAGHMAATIPAEAICCADHLVEQVPPITAWGKRFATIPLASRTKGDFFRLIAAEDGTAVYFNGQLDVKLNKGQWVERIIKNPTEIIATKPIMVAQLSTSIRHDPPTSGKADPFLMIIPPYSQFLNHYTITTPPTGFEINFINVVAPTAALGSVTLDGTAIPAASFTPIGVSGYSGAQIPISVGAHVLDGPSAFGVFVYGYAQDEGYGYPGGMNMTPVIAATNVVVSPETSSHSINTQACVVATVTDQDQNPLGGRSLSFSVTGANPSALSAQTDAAGQATLCYTGANTGTDQIAAAVGTSTGTATVIWTPPNLAPVVNAGADQTITLPAVANLQGTVTDDGLPSAALSVTWSKMSGPGNVVFANVNAASTTASFDADGVYVLRLSASDTALTTTDDVQITVNSAPPNEAPSANAGPDATVTINGNLVLNAGNELDLVEGEISRWMEVQGASWTRANASSGAGFPDPQRGNWYFFAGEDAQAELRQDVDVSAFATSIAAGTQQFEFEAYLRSAAEATPDVARIVVEYRDATNTNVIATLDSGEIASTNGWHLTEDLRVAPFGTGWIRIRLMATRNSGTTNDAFFDSVSLRPIGNTAIKLQGTATDDGLPVGSSLSTTWTKVSGPGTVTFTDANSPVSGAAFDVAGTYVLRLTGTDGSLSHGDDVSVVVNPINLAPVVNAGANQTITLPSAAELSGTATDDGQPPAGSLTVTWSRIAGPGTVSFANANALSTSATFSAPGVYILRLNADDTEYAASSDVTITVNPAAANQPPTANAGADQTISLPDDTTDLNGVVTDDGLPAGGTLSINWSKTSGPGNAAFANANSAVTTVQFSEPGSYVLRLTASDGEYTVFDELVITVTPQNQAPTANAGTDQTTLLSQPAQLNGSASDDGLPTGNLTTLWSKVSGPGDVNFLNPTFTVSGAQFSATGTYVLRLTASDGALTGSDDVTITVIDNVALPAVEITSPEDGSEWTEPTAVTGSISNGDWAVEYSLNVDDGSNNQIWTQFGSGSGPVSNALLGTLDTTLMLNGTYSVRLRATDEHGQTSFTSISVLVDKGFKVGQLQLAFSDLNVPVAGLPIEVIRSYDSRDKRVGDFGVGWQMSLRNARVEKTGVLGLGWHQSVSSGIIPTYCLEPSRPHKVTVTFGNGQVFKFLASTAIKCQQFAPVTSTQLTFTPQPGTRATLEVVGPTDVLVESLGSIPGPARLLNQSNPDIFNSFTFRLTTPEGVRYVINQQSGVSSIADPYGNSLTINANGVVHSSGKSISFTRDALGRITEIVDPEGNPQTYTYDDNGDLVTFKDRENNETKFEYNSDHHLLKIFDARGINVLTNQYDPSGRLIGQLDAFNKSVVYDHDIPNRAETVTDRLGHATRYEYDERGNVLRQVDAKNGVKTFTYDEFDNVLTETNELNKTTVYTYDAADNRTSIEDPLHNTTRFTYNNARQVLTVRDARDKLTVNEYDPVGVNLVSTKDPLDNLTTYDYSLFTGQRTKMTDALGRETKYDYDAAQRLTKEIDPLGNITSHDYDTNNNRIRLTVKRTNAQGQIETIVTHYAYDKLNRLIKTTFADNSFMQIEYNAIGLQRATIDQLNRRTEFTYDEMGRLTRTDYPDGTHDEATYDAEGRRRTSKDRAGRVTTYEYDELGRLTKTISVDNTFTSTTYDAAGQVRVARDARGNLTHYEYDDAGRRTTAKNALNQESTFTYDANGNLLTMKDALLRTTRYEYDDNNRRVKTIFHDDSFETVEYDKLGRSVLKKDQAGKPTSFFYDELGRLVKVKDALNQETIYGYNELSQQTTQTDASNHTTRFEYDQLGRRVKRILPGGQFETYSYDLGGSLQSRTDFNGKTTTFTYDAMRRLRTKVPDASLNQPTISFTYNANGQRATMTDASGQTVYTYDVRNRLENKQTPFGTLSYTYDDAGSVLTVRSSNANGVSVDYVYDELNRLKTVKDNRLLALNGGTTTYNYDAVGNLDNYVYPNSVTTSYNYNSLNRLTSMNTAAGATTQSSYTYTLGPTGNRTAVSELGGRTVNYTYDDLYRLKSETIANDPHSINGLVSYDYDPVGNRLSRASTVTGVPSQSSTFDANDRLNAESYDANGNTTSANSNSYAYDFENRLTSLNNGAATFVYDGDGNRISKTVGAVTTNYLVDTNNHTGYAQVVEEIQTGSVTKQFTFGHDLVSQRIIGGSLSFYSYDGHGSVRQLTDASASVTDTYDYDAFGILISHTGTTPNDNLYSGEQFDANLGFQYLRARYMNPSAGRFLTIDPYEGNASDSISLHKYLYAGADPVNRIDPSGFIYLASEAQAAQFRTTINTQATLQYQSVLRAVQPELVNAAMAEVAAGAVTTTGTAAATSATTALSSALAFLGGVALGTAVSEVDDDTEVFFRSMSFSDFEQMSATRQVPIHGESFVTRSFEYQVHLWFDTRLRYDVFVIFLMAGGTEAALQQAGAVSNSAVELKPSLKRLPNISTIPNSRKKDVVHIKGEYGALTYGLRENSAAIFNSRIIAYFGVGL